MPLIDILLIAVGLAMDAFTVALAVGLHLSANGDITPRQYFRLGFHFGLFQFLMPVLGWLAGATVKSYIDSFDHWIALVLLVYIGVKLMREGGRSEEYQRRDPTKGSSLVILSLATSIDALAMGLSLAILGSKIIYPAAIIGLVAAMFTLAGLRLGKQVGLIWRNRVAIFGGLILIGIGAKIAIEHIFP